MDSVTTLLGLCAVGIGVGLLLLWRGFGGYRAAAVIGDTATSTTETLAAGEVRITGTIESAEVTLVSPLQSKPCVWYRARVRAAGRNDLEVFAEERAVGFRVRDAEGSIRVFPAGARMGVSDRFRARTGMMGDQPPGLDLRSGGAFGPAVGPDGETPLDREAAIAALLTVRQPREDDLDLDGHDSGYGLRDDGRREYEESRLEIGDTVTIVGTALPFGHLRDPFGADRMDRAGDPLVGLDDPEVAAALAAARAAGTLLTPEEAWGNAAIPGFGIGRPAWEPDLDPGANRAAVVPETAPRAVARFNIDPDTLVIAAVDGAPLIIAEGAPSVAAEREQGRFLLGLLGAALAVGSAIVGAVIIGGLPA